MRECDNWIDSFLQYTEIGEAPTHFYFWTAVSTIAAALQRRVYFDQSPFFKWYANFYIILVAPPGIVQKSTTADVGMELLIDVPGVHIGPSSCSWQKLLTLFNTVEEHYIDPIAQKDVEHRSLTIFASELGNFIRANDNEMIDILTHMWDCKDIKRSTHAHGDENVIKPCFNFIGCVTDEGVAQLFPHYMIGGGLVSRTIWVWGDEKRHLEAYPGDRIVGEESRALRSKLVHDLNEMMTLNGAFKRTSEATIWGNHWYKQHFTDDVKRQVDSNFKGYIARKQAHIHKLAMILSVARGDSLTLELSDLMEAAKLVTALEQDAGKIFALMGRSQEANYADRLIEYVSRKGKVTLSEAFNHMRGNFPRLSDFEEVVKGLVRADMLATSGIHFTLGSRALAACSSTHDHQPPILEVPDNEQDAP